MRRHNCITICRRSYFRRRPYRVECTGSLSTSEVKQHRARLVLGWGTAWEDLRVLSAFSTNSSWPSSRSFGDLAHTPTPGHHCRAPNFQASSMWSCGLHSRFEMLSKCTNLIWVARKRCRNKLAARSKLHSKCPALTSRFEQGSTDW